MKIKNILAGLKEKAWRLRLPEEYRSFSVEQMEREYQQFYKKLEKMTADPAASVKEMDLFLEKNRRLIKAARLFRKRIQKNAIKQAARKRGD